MKNNLTLLVALVAFATTAFAGSEINSLTSQIRNQNTFYGIVLASDLNVVLSQGNPQSVKVEAAKADLPFINTRVINNSLVVSVRNNHKLSGPANVYITMSDINQIEIIGNGKVKSTEPINADVLTLKVKGNGSINVDVRALSVGINLDGCGSINVSGNAVNSLIKISGQGQVVTGNFNSLNTVEMIDSAPVDCTAMKIIKNAELRMQN